MLDLCSLCSIELPNHPLTHGENRFCCAGCHAVFNILSAKNQLEHYENHPIFNQAIKSGLISNPLLLEQIKKNRVSVAERELERIHLEITDMWCPACSELIRLFLLQHKGIQNCVVDYATDLASIEFAPRYIAKEKIFSIIESFGYHPVPLGQENRLVKNQLYLRFLISVFCAFNTMMFAYPIYAAYFHHDPQGYGGLFAWLSFFMTIPIVTYSFWPILKRFFTSLQVGYLGMETLVTLGVSAALGLSVYNLFHGNLHVYFDSLSVIICFVLLGKMIESRAKFSAKEAFIRLVRAMPRRGRKQMSDGSLAFVPLKEIVPGDLIQVNSGEKIVLDGVVVEGQGNCDESLMTGESVHVSKTRDSPVLGGTMLQAGCLVVRVTSRAEESALGKIIELLQFELGDKLPYIRLTDHIVKWFVPLVVVLAVFSAGYSFASGAVEVGKSLTETAFIRFISVLLISCPCAIGIAVPLVESYLMNAFASLGAIVRNRNCLSILGTETVVVFDKTGTVTEGKFELLHGLDALNQEQIAILKGICLKSSHPISVAISHSIDLPATAGLEAQEVIGQGMRAVYLGKTYYLGSASFLKDHQVIVDAQLLTSRADSFAGDHQSLMQTQVYFAQDKICLAVLTLGDRLKLGMIDLIQNLKPLQTILLSGDAEEAVNQVATRCKFDQYYAQCNPLQKREIIQSLKTNGAVVCMIGDGINDALALTAAHVGISVVSATDISIQVSDLLLTTDRLPVLLEIRRLAKKATVISKQNLFWTFFYNGVGVGLAVMGWLSPIFAAFAMMASSAMVIFNASRVQSKS